MHLGVTIMEDQIALVTEEVTTSPGLIQQNANDHGKSHAESAPRRKNGFFARLWPRMQAYGAALVASYAIVPSIATIFTVVFYLVASNVPGWQLVAWGFIVTGIVWLALSIPLSALTSAGAANPLNYGLIENRLSRLETRFFVIQNTTTEKQLKQYQQVALEEAYDNLSKLHHLIYRSTSRLPWVLAMGYVNAWNWLHRTEEALIEIEPLEIVVSGAYHDYMAISNSKMDNSKDLLANLTDATKKLDPKFASVFAASSLSSGESEVLGEIEQGVHKIEQGVHQIATKLGVQLGESDDQAAKTEKTDKNHASTPDREANARVTLHQIRRALNEFRDTQRLGIVSLRNQLMANIFVTGFVTYALLCTVVLAVVHTNSSAQSERATILAAVVFYIVGAMAGLFGRIYSESKANTGGDDFGLSLGRLISTPLISGIAGIGGVFLYNIIILQVVPGSSSVLLSIFNINRLDYLIAAAVVGYAPNLLMKGLQANKYVSALQSSQTSRSTDASTQQSELN
jgi:hypothetical protein